MYRVPFKNQASLNVKPVSNLLFPNGTSSKIALILDRIPSPFCLLSPIVSIGFANLPPISHCCHWICKLGHVVTKVFFLLWIFNRFLINKYFRTVYAGVFTYVESCAFFFHRAPTFSLNLINIVIALFTRPVCFPHLLAAITSSTIRGWVYQPDFYTCTGGWDHHRLFCPIGPLWLCTLSRPKQFSAWLCCICRNVHSFHL